MRKLIFLILLLAGILIPSMLGYVKKSRAVSERVNSQIEYQNDYDMYQF